MTFGAHPAARFFNFQGLGPRPVPTHGGLSLESKRCMSWICNAGPGWVWKSGERAPFLPPNLRVFFEAVSRGVGGRRRRRRGGEGMGERRRKVIWYAKKKMQIQNLSFSHPKGPREKEEKIPVPVFSNLFNHVQSKNQYNSPPPFPPHIPYSSSPHSRPGVSSQPIIKPPVSGRPPPLLRRQRREKNPPHFDDDSQTAAGGGRIEGVLHVFLKKVFIPFPFLSSFVLPPPGILRGFFFSCCCCSLATCFKTPTRGEKKPPPLDLFWYFF